MDGQNPESAFRIPQSKRLVSALLDWYAANARDLPWRRTRDPYAIWVSEIMLQQTQVKTVIPYWERWMRVLPTVEALARAKPAKIHKLWEGLGYYSRVRNLQKAAQQIVSRGNARLQPSRRQGNDPQDQKKPESFPEPADPPNGPGAQRSPTTYGPRTTFQSGRGLPHSRTLSRPSIEDPSLRAILSVETATERTGTRKRSPHPKGRCQGGASVLASCRFPDNYADLLALPGVGRYTAGAICSIAFNQPKPILDGNVIRVLTRIFGITDNPRERKANARLWEMAARLVETAARRETGRTRTKDEDDWAASHFNQSLMELGALVCLPRNPRCGECPAKNLCAALREDHVAELPNLGRRAASTERWFAAFVVEHNGRYLVRQRPAGIVNAHLWEFPNVEIQGPTRGDCGAIASAAKRLFGQYPAELTSFCTINHSITRYRITLETFQAKFERHRNHAGTWRTPAQMHRLAFAAAHKKVLARL